MCLRDLTGKRQPNATPLVLGRIEGYECIAWIEKSRSIVVDGQHYILIFDCPIYRHRRRCDLQGTSRDKWSVIDMSRLKNGFDSIAHEIDQHLLDLIWINH